MDTGFLKTGIYVSVLFGVAGNDTPRRQLLGESFLFLSMIFGYRGEWCLRKAHPRVSEFQETFREGGGGCSSFPEGAL